VAKRVPPPSAKRPRGTASEQMARDAIAHAEPALGDKVRMTFRVVLSRRQAEALTARAIREERPAPHPTPRCCLRLARL
jgi:hypothetical protein